MTLTSPADASPLPLLDPPARLHVPLGTHSPMEIPAGIEIGATVAKGQMLASGPFEGGPAALAPTSGRIIGISTVTLTNGQTVPAVELESDFQDRRIPEEHDAQQAGAQRELIDSLDRVSPADLGAWI